MAYKYTLSNQGPLEPLGKNDISDDVSPQQGPCRSEYMTIRKRAPHSASQVKKRCALKTYLPYNTNNERRVRTTIESKSRLKHLLEYHAGPSHTL